MRILNSEQPRQNVVQVQRERQQLCFSKKDSLSIRRGYILQAFGLSNTKVCLRGIFLLNLSYYLQFSGLKIVKTANMKTVQQQLSSHNLAY